MARVYQMRAGAPDKINLRFNGALIKLDNKNLVDFTDEEIGEMIRSGYILPADEGDIRRANELYESVHKDQYKILLPLTFDGEAGQYKVIDYNTFIPKDSKVYSTLEDNTGIIYPEFESLTLDDFKKEVGDRDLLGKCIKTSTGSGSRGVYLIDPDRVHLGGKFVKSQDDIDWEGFYKYVESQGPDTRILIQDLVPMKPGLFKCNVDLVIKGSRLIAWKWDKTDPTAVFTNWNFGWFIFNQYVESKVYQVVDHLIYQGLTDGIMNFECYSDLESETYMIEFNYRYSNSMFEWEALGYDPIWGYIEGEDFKPSQEMYQRGSLKFSRYWKCKLYSDLNIPD